MGLHLYLCSILAVTLISISSAAEWSYSGTYGPSHWKDMTDNEACGLNKQSPINIVYKDMEYKPSLGVFTFTGYKAVPTGTTYTLKNNGHTAQVDVDVQASQIAISGADLGATYNLAQFHFHWGEVNSQGSEHTVDSNQFPLEMHMVHFKSEYSTLGDAADKDKGLAVLGFFFEVTGNTNAAFDSILSQFGSISYADKNTQLSSTFPMFDLLPSEAQLANYMRYSGSLTTPPCYESVIWTVFQPTIKISQAQLDKFRNLYKNEQGQANEKIKFNFRPVQPLNGRKVYATFMDSGAMASLTVSKNTLLVGACLILYRIYSMF